MVEIRELLELLDGKGLLDLVIGVGEKADGFMVLISHDVQDVALLWILLLFSCILLYLAAFLLLVLVWLIKLSGHLNSLLEADLLNRLLD